MEAKIAQQGVEMAPEEAGRWAVYSFLSRVLAAPIQASEGELCRLFKNDQTSIGQAFQALESALTAAPQGALRKEYNDLFIGVGRGEVLPYGSYYLTGFLNEKPLAQLRQDLAALGLARTQGVPEPEDHMASLCEVMALLIEGTASGEYKIYDQDTFFGAHMAAWAAKFFADLETAKQAQVYREVGRLGSLFMAIEEEGLSMIARA